jgi:hypothetical protein
MIGVEIWYKIIPWNCISLAGENDNERKVSRCGHILHAEITQIVGHKVVLEIFQNECSIARDKFQASRTLKFTFALTYHGAFSQKMKWLSQFPPQKNPYSRQTASDEKNMEVYKRMELHYGRCNIDTFVRTQILMRVKPTLVTNGRQLIQDRQNYRQDDCEHNNIRCIYRLEEVENLGEQIPIKK